MKMQLLGGVALALILGVSSAAYANPKNSFSDYNSIWVSSNAYADAEAGTTSGKCSGCIVEGGDSANNNDADATALSETLNISIEAVEVSNLSSYAVGVIYQESGEWGFNEVDWGNAHANSSGDTLSQASASNGVGNATTQGQSIAAAADVRF